MSKYSKTVYKTILTLIILCSTILPSKAFWLLGFSNAYTLPPACIGFIGGTGGQLTDVGNPGLLSYTPFLAHAGIRVGLSKRIDWGYRLCTVAMPYSSAGPSLGAETDVKIRITPDSSKWQAAVVAGAGYSYLYLLGETRNAWAPGVALIASRALSSRVMLSLNARYVFTGITSAPGGELKNNLTAMGGSVNIGIKINKTTTIVPEMGLFDFSGNIGGKQMNGTGFQYGCIIAARIN